MIRDYFSTQDSRRRPFIDAILQFPILNDRSLDVKLLVDTGADRTILSPLDARRLARRFALDLVTLPHRCAKHWCWGTVGHAHPGGRAHP